MKIKICSLLAMTSLVLPTTILSRKNNLKTTTSFTIDFHINKESRVEAEYTNAQAESSDTEVISTGLQTLNFSDFEQNHIGFKTDLIIEFDLSGSLVDKYYQKKYLKNNKYSFKFDNLANNFEYNKLIGSEISQVNADYIKGSYYARYIYNKATNTFVFEIVLISYAFNGGNGSINTAGKGTNVLKFNNITFVYEV